MVSACPTSYGPDPMERSDSGSVGPVTEANGGLVRLHFAKAFQAAARRTRRRRALRSGLAGSLVGGVAAASLTLSAWALNWSGERLTLCFAAALGALSGLVVSRLKSWDDRRVALFLDRSLGADESIVTALELSEHAGEPPVAFASVVQRAQAQLQRRPSPPLPTIWQSYHWLLVPALGCALLFAWLPLPAPAAAASKPGSEIIRRSKVAGLDALASLQAPKNATAAERARLQRLVHQARKLQRELQQGMPRREAQADLARLQSELRQERQRLGAGPEKAGLQAALNELSDAAPLASARQALARADLAALEHELQALANRSNSAQRSEAGRRLRRAAKKAKEQGAETVARALNEQAKRLADAAFDAAQLEQLQRAMSAKKGTAPSTAPTASTLAQQLAQMTPKERAELAQRLLQQQPKTASERQAQKALAEALQRPNGSRQLLGNLRSPGNTSPAPSTQHQQQLRRSERALARGQRQLLPQASRPGPAKAATPPIQAQATSSPTGQSPTPGGLTQGHATQGHATQGHATQGHATQGQTGNPGGHTRNPGGHTRNPGGQTGNPGGNGNKTAGSTGRSPAEELRLRVASRHGQSGQPGSALPTLRGPTAASERATQPSEAINSSRPQNRSRGTHANPVPSEYREQVRRYFERNAPTSAQTGP